MGRKRGQITLFIIIALVLVLSTVLFIYIASRREVIPVSTVPEEFQPIKKYIDTCLEVASREAITRLGLQGGYVEVPDQLRNSAKILNIVPEVRLGIPYWYFQGNNYYPSLEGMEKQIEDFVIKEVQECTGDFEVFSDTFQVQKKGDMKAIASINDQDVTVQLDYPLQIQIRQGSRDADVKNFVYKAPVRVKRAYELALNILDDENNQMFLEDATFNLMSLSPDIPITEATFQCSAFVKKISTVKSNLKDIISYNFADIRINNTRYKEFIPGDKTYAENWLFWDIGTSDFQDMSVYVDYQPDWPMKILISPHAGPLLKAEPIKLVGIIPTCFLQYHYTYDLDFPVRVSIIDQQTMSHDAYRFDFAIPVLLNHNRGDRISNPTHAVDNVVPVYDTSFCDNYPTTQMTFYAKNIVNHEDLYWVNLTARCAAFECPLGRISIGRGTYNLVKGVPDCVYATIIAEKDGYQTREQGLETRISKNVYVEMLPLRNIDYVVYKHPISDPGTIERLASDELVTITMHNEEYDYSVEAVYPMFNQSNFDLITDWNFDYDVELMLIKNESFVGGYKGNFRSVYNEFKTSSELAFHVFYDPEAVDDEDRQFELITDMEGFSSNIHEPEFT